MRKCFLLFITFIFILPTIIFAGAKPGEPGHLRPFGKTIAGHNEDNQYNGFVHTSNRVILDETGNQFILQLYSSMTLGVEQVKMDVYWIYGKIGEVVSVIPPVIGIEFHPDWIEIVSDSRKPIFAENRKDAPISILHDYSPFNREIRLVDIIDYKLENVLNLPENIQPWIFRDVDGDSFEELICVDHSLSNIFDFQTKPHSMIVYKIINDEWQKIDSTLYKKWDIEFIKFAEDQKDERRISACMSLGYSLYSHGNEEIFTKVEEILFDESGYTNSKVPTLAKESLTKLKNYLNPK